MSSHIVYRTTTFEYYYVMPHTYESLLWPLDADDSFMEIWDRSCYDTEAINDVVQYIRPPATMLILEYHESRHDPPQYCMTNQEEDGPCTEEITKESGQQQDIDEALLTPKKKKKHVYQAEEGYLVEEPTSDEEDTEDHKNSADTSH